MIIVALVILGLALGSFVNALVWRLHEQASSKKHNPKLSILKGRSMCPHCKHELKALDLIPVLSWLALRGKCRYCKKPISIQYPLVELMTALMFVISYLVWPYEFSSGFFEVTYFVLWLLVLVVLMALLIYDLRWMILPDKLVTALAIIAAPMGIITVINANKPLLAFSGLVLAVVVGGGLFYVLYQVSAGKWIGGGDVKLGWAMSLFLATPAKSFLMIFIACLLGSLISLPLLASKKLKKDSVIAFGPFLIVSAVIVMLYGQTIIDWYHRTFIGI